MRLRGVLALTLVLAFSQAPDAAEIRLAPGDDLQAAVDTAAPGSVFVLTPGIYRRQSVVPKDGQEFVGETGAVLNGAMLLTDWRRDGDHWSAGGLPVPLRLHGFCLDERPLCRHREDLFVDGRLFQRVASRDDLDAGTWAYQDGRAYLAEAPDGRSVELSVTPQAFGGDADGVVLRNLVVEKYAARAQKSAIDASDGRAWKVLDVTARWNHGIGLRIGDDIVVRGGFYGRNGQMGMGGGGDRALIEGVEIAHNNYAGYSKSWEAGGTKFVRSDGLIVRGACVHGNDGVGLWLDIDNINILIENNVVFDNSRSGISHEISYKATIRNNRVGRNGRSKDVWLWGSQILVQNSRDVEVSGNRVEVSADGGNGIGVIYQDRRKDGSGPYLTRNNRIHGNEIILTGRGGRSGIVADFDTERFWAESDNSFDGNVYYAPGRFSKHWAFDGKVLNWLQVQWRGLEPNGSLIVSRPPSMNLSCKPRA